MHRGIDLKLKPVQPLHPQLLRGLMNSGKSIFAQLMDFVSRDPSQQEAQVHMLQAHLSGV